MKIIDVDDIENIESYSEKLSEKTSFVKEQLKFISEKYIPKNTNSSILLDRILNDMEIAYNRFFQFELDYIKEKNFYSSEKDKIKNENEKLNKNIDELKSEIKILKNKNKKNELKIIELNKNEIKNYIIFGFKFKKGSIKNLVDIFKENKKLKKEISELKEIIGE